jgi:hypothetical protein
VVREALASSVLVCALVACADEARDSVSGGGPGGIGEEATGASTDDPGADVDGDEKLDLGGGGPGGEGGGDEAGDAGCRSVDFLFVIDSSISMASNQGDLVAAFPAFVDTITSTLVEVDSYHVGGVTSDAYGDNEPGCTQLGALVTRTGGPDSSGQDCGPFAEGRYMTEADDLPTTFACAARVGTGGDNDERMMGAALAAISADMNAAGACNEGFIRDDALLVMVLITDEDDPGSCGIPGVSCNGSGGTPPSWHTEVLDRKVHPENAVVLTLTRGAPGNVCGDPGLAEIDAARLMAFAALFQSRGFRGDICAPFGPFFEEAVGLIESACEDFVPVG